MKEGDYVKTEGGNVYRLVKLRPDKLTNNYDVWLVYQCSGGFRDSMAVLYITEDVKKVVPIFIEP